MVAFSILTFSAPNSMAIDVQPAPQKGYNIEQHQPALRLKNYFLNDIAVTTLFKADGKIYLPYGQNILFSGNIYAARKNNALPSFASALEIYKRESITDFGVIGYLKWPLIQRDNWSIDINGKVSGSKQYLGTAHQKNRWNFEHQIGWDANYQLSDDLHASVGVYHYRIVDGTQNHDPTGSYINSGGGFASLRLHF